MSNLQESVRLDLEGIYCFRIQKKQTEGNPTDTDIDKTLTFSQYFQNRVKGVGVQEVRFRRVKVLRVVVH